MNKNDSISIKLFDKTKVVLENEIGRGSFGKVYKATVSQGKLSTVAVKIFRKDLKQGATSQREKDIAYEELLKLAVLDHENIVKLHGMVQDAESELPWLIFEFMKDGNLLEYVIKNDNIREKTLIRFCRDICCGMAFLHSNQVLHKDLAARNILLCDGRAKISDLGLSSFLTNDEGGVYALNGKLFPYRHAAMECVVEQIYTFESDVWSFGVLMHEIFNGGLTPYGKHNKQPEVRRLIVQGITPLTLSEPHCSLRIIEVMKSVLNPKMKERPIFFKLYQKFQKFLNERIELKNNENLHSDTSAALSAFHKIKAGGLSTSINNLQVSTISGKNDSANHVLLSGTKNGQFLNKNTLSADVGHLSVSQSYSSKSTSTPDIATAVEASANAMQLLANNFLSMRSSPGGRRRSLVKFEGEIPLERRRNSEEKHKNVSQISGSSKLVDEFSEEPRRRANSSSRAMNNPLLQGFVQNRFAKKL